MSLSQKQYGDLRSLYESIYTPKTEVLEEEFISEEMLHLSDEEIVEQVEEFFQECVEEGLDIDLVEQTICEHIDSLEVLSERVDPKETQRRRDQAKDRLATGSAMKSAAEKSASKSDGGGGSSKLSRIKGAVKTAAKAAKAGIKAAGKATQGGVGLAARAVGTAQRAGSAVKGAAKSGYARGKGGSTSSSSGSSDSGETGASSSSGSSSSSGGSGGSSSSAPAKRKDGLLKRGLKKLIRGVGKTVSATAGAVKAGADSITDRARKEELEASGLFSDKEIESIVEAMSSYDRNRKRAAQRAADRNAARAAGKTGVVPGVGYVTPRREKETYTDEKGTTRHKSGAAMPKD
jgi:hypothetical protein